MTSKCWAVASSAIAFAYGNGVVWFPGTIVVKQRVSAENRVQHDLLHCFDLLHCLAEVAVFAYLSVVVVY